MHGIASVKIPEKYKFSPQQFKANSIPSYKSKIQNFKFAAKFLSTKLCQNFSNFTEFLVMFIRLKKNIPLVSSFANKTAKQVKAKLQ